MEIAAPKTPMIQRLREMMLRPSERVVDWSTEERQAFLLFSKSVAGRKLLEFLRQHAAAVTFNVVRSDAASMNAYARGVQDVVLLISNMALVPDVETGLDENELEPLPSQRSRQFIPRGNFSGI
jgi:hypothetical protein